MDAYCIGRLRLSVCRPDHSEIRRATYVVAVGFCLATFLVQGQAVRAQSKDQSGAATLQGFVLDPRGHPVGAAVVYLQANDGTQTLTARTDSEGSYRFSLLSAGAYKLRAEMAGYAGASFGPCVIGPKETKRIDLKLEPAPVPTPKNGSSGAFSGISGAGKPQYFDDPQFTVAGVTEAMDPGGHGSNVILRTTESLAKETASLGVSSANTESSASGMPTASPSSRAAAEESLRVEAGREPQSFEANYRLGKMLVDNGKSREALSYLERASQLNPGDYENAYELVLARSDAGQCDRARAEAQALLVGPNRTLPEQAELHHLLGNIEEKGGNPLDAVREYQRGAELYPSEPNLFDWGADLLLHRAFEPAIEVFTKGNRLFPSSARMLTGIGVAWYARGSYDQAARSLCEASDLDPNDPNPYLFLGKMQTVETMQSDCVVERLKRFVGLQPENALAHYYYALVLSRQDGSQDANNSAQVKLLLDEAVHLDPKLAPAYLQLGILYSQQGESAKAISAYQKAIEANPQLDEAHYRLAQAYNRAGEKLKAQAELQLYEQLSKKTVAESDRERREIQQFVYTLRDGTSVSQPQ